MLRLAFSILFLLSPFAYAADNGDVCAIRPDLCDDTAKAPVAKSSSASIANCRTPGASYSLAQANLPLCGTPAKAQPAAHMQAQPVVHTQAQRPVVNDDIFDDPKPVVKTAPRRSPASVPKLATISSPHGMTFDDYLNRNALNPALSAKISDHQNAFVDRPVSATYSMPSDGISTGVSEPGSITVPTPSGSVTVPINGSGGSGQPTDGFSSPPGS